MRVSRCLNYSMEASTDCHNKNRTLYLYCIVFLTLQQTCWKLSVYVTDRGFPSHLMGRSSSLFLIYTTDVSVYTGALRLTSISEVEILGDGGGNAKSDNIISGRNIYNKSTHTITRADGDMTSQVTDLLATSENYGISSTDMIQYRNSLSCDWPAEKQTQIRQMSRMWTKKLTNRSERIILDNNGSGIREIWTFSGRRMLPPSRSATTTSNCTTQTDKWYRNTTYTQTKIYDDTYHHSLANSSTALSTVHS